MLSNIYKQKVKQALTLALPIVTGQLGQVLMGFFDTVQIGGLGHEYIAAAGFANGIYWAIVLFGIGTLMSIAPLVSETFGEKHGYKSVGNFFAGIVVSLGLSVIFMTIIEIVARNLYVFGHSESDTILGGKFMHVINYSTPFIFLFTTAKQFLDGMGKTRVGMIVTILGLLLNIVLNVCLIYGEYGFPSLGIEGSALASTIARIAMTAFIIIYISRNKKITELRQEFSAKKEQISAYILPILAVGLPTGAQFFFEVAAFSGGQIMSGWISTEAEAAHLIAIGLASITFMILTGFSAAGSIMIGYAFGERDKQEIRRAGYTIFGIVLVMELIYVVFFISLRNYLPMVYTDNTEVIKMAATMLIFAAAFQISDGTQTVLNGALRGMQDTKFPAIFALFSYGSMIPISYFLAFKLELGLKGIWIGFIIGLTIAAILLVWRFFNKLKQLDWDETATGTPEEKQV